MTCDSNYRINELFVFRPTSREKNFKPQEVLKFGPAEAKHRPDEGTAEGLNVLMVP